MSQRDQLVVSLFTGAGGLDVGLGRAGFEVAIAVETDCNCLETIKMNNQWHISSTTDIREVCTRALLSEAGLRVGEPALVVGGPPCQPFSKSGFWVNGDSTRLKDDRARTIHHYFRIVGDVLPKAILFENVLGIGFKDKREALQLIEAELQRINRKHKTHYCPVFIKLNAADYGVPQTRERLFVVASREGKSFSLPEVTHAPLDSLSSTQTRLSRYTNVWDAIGDLDTIDHGDELKPRGKWSELLPSIPEGHNYLWHTPVGGGTPIFGWRTRYWSFLLKLKKNRPSWTLQASPGPATGPFHWRNRHLSVQEMARIQTFPDSYSFAGGYRVSTRQIGNAVPPAIGELFGKCIMNQFFDQEIDTSLTLIPKIVEPTPNAHRRRQVPLKFAEGIHDTTAHPGTGRGPRAMGQGR